MPDPLDTNDDWAELARELDRNKPPAPPPAPPADMVERHVEEEAVEPHHGFDPRVEDEAVAEGEPEAAADEEFDDAEEAASSEGEATAEGQPGTGRKRRRRRRRRRKGGAPEGAPLTGEATPEGAETEGEAEPLVAEDAGAPEGDDFAAEDEETEMAPLAVVEEEDTATEALRDLIANWNVPSWDDIVGGLYRPDR